MSNILKIASLAHLSVCTRYIPIAPVKVNLFVVDMWTEKQKGGGVVIYLKINCNFSLEENAIELVCQGWDGMGWVGMGRR